MDAGHIRDAAEAMKGIVEAVPVYQDAVQPLAKQVGAALETVGRAVNVALAPLRALVWGAEQIEAYIGPALIERLRNVPEERIQTPSPIVAGPALEALRFAGPDPNLR